MTTISKDMTALEGVFFAIGGGKFKVRLYERKGSRYRSGVVLDNEGNVIGSASDYTYGGAGWAIHTPMYAGHASLDQVVIVD